MFFTFVIVMTMVASVSVFASAHKEQCNDHKVTTNVAIQGARCNGTVGCGCPGFSPITNGDVWQQAYCRHCGHHRRVHK